MRYVDMEKLTLLLMFAFTALSFYRLGRNLTILRELKKWNKAIDDLDIKERGWEFAEGFLWAYEKIVAKDEDDE